jgi:hypothetical protein
VRGAKFGGTSQSDDAFDNKGKVFYLLLASGLCLVLFFTFLK